jgi:adenosine deaminase
LIRACFAAWISTTTNARGICATFQRFFRLARERGLALKAHAGETCGPERVRETLEILEVDAIQHGVAAIQDPKLLEELARRGTQLNLGIASNIALGVAGSYDDHPIRTLLAAGVKVALGTDDFAIFGASLCDEISRLRRSGVRLGDLAKCASDRQGSVKPESSGESRPRMGWARGLVA